MDEDRSKVQKAIDDQHGVMNAENTENPGTYTDADFDRVEVDEN